MDFLFQEHLASLQVYSFIPYSFLMQYSEMNVNQSKSNCGVLYVVYNSSC